MTRKLEQERKLQKRKLLSFPKTLEEIASRYLVGGPKSFDGGYVVRYKPVCRFKDAMRGRSANFTFEIAIWRSSVLSPKLRFGRAGASEGGGGACALAAVIVDAFSKSSKSPSVWMAASRPKNS